MKNKKYLEAAELFCENTSIDFACEALNRVKKPVDNFQKMFRPSAEEHIYVGYNGVFLNVFFGETRNEENRLARSLALLFMYEMGAK